MGILGEILGEILGGGLIVDGGGEMVGWVFMVESVGCGYCIWRFL